MGQAVYAIDAFPDDDLLWRIEWIGGVGYNTETLSRIVFGGMLTQRTSGLLDMSERPLRVAHVEERL